MNSYDKLLWEVLSRAHGKPSGESCQESTRAPHSLVVQPPFEAGSLIHPLQSALAIWRVMTRLSKDVEQLGCFSTCNVLVTCAASAHRGTSTVSTETSAANRWDAQPQYLDVPMAELKT